MLKELPKRYNPKGVEDKWYQCWVDNKCFTPDTNDKGGDNFTIMIPPPNITGTLHMGHVLNNTIQDVLVRKARMEGKNTLWLPGTDHASIATETKVVQMLKKQGIKKSDINRHEFLKHAYEWKEKYGGIIINQLKKLGCSCDWSREKFTMDKDYSHAVLSAFVKLYNDGMIYQGKRIINWDPEGLTALSDEEVIYKETKSYLWHFKYPIKGSSDFLVVATTRPETMLGDTGLAVNPKDKRYSKYIGQKIILPITGREIPIFSDDYVDMKFGTGCVKVTPAHDPNDFAMATRNNLRIINIMHPNATLNENVPKDYQGLDRYQARKKVVDHLESLQLLEKIDDYVNNVGYSERTNVVVEPYLSKQWFINMKPFVKEALESVDKKNVQFHPNKWIKTYNHWLNNIQDWCISRQLWWGHQIPVWYKGDKIYCGLEPPEEKGWIQEEDVLDTWFSSWLWPFATLGWPDNTKDLKTFYPTNDLVTGPDIIFFWVARMIMAGQYFLDDSPFSNVYFTGIIRDNNGRKMSKSLGNSPDPLDLFSHYGADAVRVGIMMIAPQGQDILFAEENMELGRNFMNKLWNSARFVIMNLDEEVNDDINNLSLSEVDLWIISRLNNTIINVNKAYSTYKMNECIKIVHEFIWRDFCDWYIELSKTNLYGTDSQKRYVSQSVAVYILKKILLLLHPYAPHISEEIWSYIKNEDDKLLIQSKWPIASKQLISYKIEKEIKIIVDIISAIRNIRMSLNIPQSKYIELIVKCNNQDYKNINRFNQYILDMTKTDKIILHQDKKTPNNVASAIVEKIELFVPLQDLINLDEEKKRLQNKIDDLQARLNSVNKKIMNKNFISRAPENIVQHEQKKAEKYENQIFKLTNNLNKIKN